MSWKDWTFLKPQGVEHEVEGRKFTFYPISVDSLFILRIVAAPVSRAFASLFQSEENDVGITERTIGGKLEDQFTTERIIAPVSLDLAKFRTQNKQKLFEEAAHVLFDPSNLRILVRFIMDSLRDEFDRNLNDADKDKEADKFMKEVDGGILSQFVVGLYNGNKKVFGPLANTVAQWKNLIGQRMRDLLTQVNPESESKSEEEKKTIKDTGVISKIPSSE